MYIIISKLRRNNYGMTLPELSLAVMSLVAFSAVYILATKYISSILGYSSSIDKQTQSWIINRNTISSSLDKWEKIITQPSYTKEEIISLGCRSNLISDSNRWSFPGDADANLPKDYKYCIFQTSLKESNFDDLVKGTNNAKPGIYILYAIPDRITPKTMPIRKIICRPRTYC